MTPSRDPERLPLHRNRPGTGSSRRAEGPTARGGAYTVMTEFPSGGETRVEIVEFDANDNPIFRAYGRLEKRSGHDDDRTS